jgi:hypothetical protein
MLTYPLIIAGISFLFYIFIPGIGAVLARRRWRRFRTRIFESADCPSIRYGDLEHDSKEGFIGYYRFIGSLEAIQGSNVAWIRDGNISVSAELDGVTVHVLPTADQEDSQPRFEQNAALLPDETPQRLPWNTISTLPEGTRLILCGALYSERGHTVFRTEKKTPLTVVLFDGTERSIFRRSIWSGRQQNEYWNQLTWISLLTGAISLFVLAYYLSRVPVLRTSAILALVAGVGPILPFFPPGIALFFLYRNLWRMGRVRRAERDLLLISTYRFDDSCKTRRSCTMTLADGELYGYTSVAGIEEAFAIAPKGRIRSTSITSTHDSDVYWVFGRPIDDPNRVELSMSDDPMAENVIISGNPWETSRICSRSARLFEFLATVSFAAGLAMNGILLLAALVSWMR